MTNSMKIGWSIMNVERFVKILGSDFYTGIPDSQLKPICDYLMNNFGISKKHVIAANEGGCTALAAGYYLATGKTPVVYMQNSGIGNIINPAASLLNDRVYGIPCLFIVGWRGEPGIPDEPQHRFQGEVTLRLLQDMEIETFVLGSDTSEIELVSKMEEFRVLFLEGKSAAVVVQKDAFYYDREMKYSNENEMKREDIIRHIVESAGSDIIVSTTGKASRELFEVREARTEGHEHDFLTVGSMGHSSSIALGIAMEKENRKVWCIDGDGALLMHMGTMAVIGSRRPGNLIHVVLNNGAHETVGGMPTVVSAIDLVKIALGCGYEKAISVHDFGALNIALDEAKGGNMLTFIEVKTAIGARKDLGRPTTKAKVNRDQFMKWLEDEV